MDIPVTYKSVSNDIVNKLKKNTTEKVVEFCSRDVRPFQIITGAGFISLAQHFVSIGAQHGEMDVTKILPHPTTVSRRVPAIKNKKLMEILPDIQKAIQNDECAATTDGWTDDNKKNCYLSMTVHYFDDDFVLQKKDLFNTLFNENFKSGVKIRQEIIRKFVSLGFDARHLHTIPIVTDRGSNVVKAFKGRRYDRRNCYAHVTNTILSNTFKHHAPLHVEFLLSDCKSIVTYLKRSSKANQLKYTPKQEVSTRWNSNLRMLNSVVPQYTEIMSLLTEAQRRDWKFSVDLGKELIRFLEPFKEVTDMLEGEKYPTSNFILLCRTDLYEHLTKGNFFGPIKTIAKFALKYLEEKWPVLMEHKIACFLDPRYRFLEMLTERERNEVFEEVHILLQEMPVPEFLTQSETDLPPAKRPKLSMYEEQVNDRDENEIELYIQTADFSEITNRQHLVETFWKENEFRFPKLYLLARRRLCIPATSAPSERLFHAAGRTINKLRTNIEPKALDNLLFLRDKFAQVSYLIYKSTYFKRNVGSDFFLSRSLLRSPQLHSHQLTINLNICLISMI